MNGIRNKRRDGRAAIPRDFAPSEQPPRFGGRSLLLGLAFGRVVVDDGVVAEDITADLLVRVSREIACRGEDAGVLRSHRPDDSFASLHHAGTANESADGDGSDGQRGKSAFQNETPS